MSALTARKAIIVLQIQSAYLILITYQYCFIVTPTILYKYNVYVTCVTFDV